jgi:hypothetical protein
METPNKFFNVRYNFDLGQAANGGYPYRQISIDNCFFMKRNGTFVNTRQELNNITQQLNNNNNEDLLIVRRNQQGNYDIPDIGNFDNYPELFDPNNPDANRNQGNNIGEGIGINEPYKITNVTKGEIENFSSREIVVTTGGKRKKQTKRRKQFKRRKFSKRSKRSKRSRKH